MPGRTARTERPNHALQPTRETLSLFQALLPGAADLVSLAVKGIHENSRKSHCHRRTSRFTRKVSSESLNKEARELYRAGKYERAVVVAKEALHAAEKNAGPDHPDVAVILTDLGEIYRAQGQYGQAEPLFERALAIAEKALSPDHPEVAKILFNLALLYHTQGQYARAESLFKRSLAILEKALGPGHPDVVASLKGMPALYRNTDRNNEAKPLEEQSAPSREIKR